MSGTLAGVRASLCQTEFQMGGDNAITRRMLIGQLTCLAARAQTDDDPLRGLRLKHPRLILLDGEAERLREAIRETAPAHRLYLDLEKESDQLLTVPPVEYRLVGPRLITQCRKVLERVSTLALMYRISQREPYQRRAVAELRAAAAFRDWNPAIFSETAEMTHAFAIGYDWLYDVMSPEDRALIRGRHAYQSARSGAADLSARRRMDARSLQRQHRVQRRSRARRACHRGRWLRSDRCAENRG